MKICYENPLRFYEFCQVYPTKVPSHEKRSVTEFCKKVIGGRKSHRKAKSRQYSNF